MECRLAAVLAADVVGYTRLMANDGTTTLALLKRRRAQLLYPNIAGHRRKISESMANRSMAKD